MKLLRLGFIVLLIFITGLLAGGGIIAMSMPVISSYSAAEPLAPTPTRLADEIFLELDALDQVMINLYDRVSPAVVHIISRSQTISPFFGSQSPLSAIIYVTVLRFKKCLRLGLRQVAYTDFRTHPAGVTGLTQAQRASLKILGAFE